MTFIIYALFKLFNKLMISLMKQEIIKTTTQGSVCIRSYFIKQTGPT